MQISSSYIQKNSNIFNNNCTKAQIISKNKSMLPTFTQKKEVEYVKVPKWQHDLEEWVFGILTAVTVFQFIHHLLSTKSANEFKL